MKTNIEWASHTWNPYKWWCTRVSPGCKNCYMMDLAARYTQHAGSGIEWRAKAWDELRRFPSGAVIFVNSMSDTYHESAPVRYIHAIHNAALANPDKTFLILTKRPERAYGLSPYLAYPPNLWVGTSVESSEYLWRLDYLLKIPSAVHFVSAEPLLEAINLNPYLRGGLQWVIVGGESGNKRRDFQKQWAAGIRDSCQRYHVPFMFKQGNALKPGNDRILDGRTWDETPFNKPEPVTLFADQLTEAQQMVMFDMYPLQNQTVTPKDQARRDGEYQYLQYIMGKPSTYVPTTKRKR